MLGDSLIKKQKDEVTRLILNNYETAQPKLVEPEIATLSTLDAPPEIKTAIHRLYSNSAGDVSQDFRDSRLVTDYFAKKFAGNVDVDLAPATKTYGPTGLSTLVAPGSLNNYEQAGSVLRRIFPSPWALHAFLADNWHTAVVCRRILSKETMRDGFSLVADKSAAKRKIKQCYEVLKKLDIKNKRNKMRDNIAWCGNSVQRKHKNRSGGITDIEILLLCQLEPIFEQYRDKIWGYQYYINNPSQEIIPASDVDHLFTYSAKSNVIAQPTMNPIVTLIEACLHSQVYQNTLMQKGGLMRGLFTMAKLSNDKEIINDKTYMELAETLTKYFEKRFGGVQGSGQLGFAPFVEKYIDLNNINAMDGAWEKLNHSTSLETCALFGVPPERVGMQRGSQYKNEAQVADSMTLGFDNELYYTLGIVDDYWNEIIEEMGFEGIRIEVDGEFSSISVSAAEFGKLISQMGQAIMSVNEFRTKVLKWAPLDSSFGDKMIGELAEADIPKAMGSPKSIKYSVNENLIRHKFDQIAYY